jgi:hypothetical protein
MSQNFLLKMTHFIYIYILSVSVITLQLTLNNYFFDDDYYKEVYEINVYYNLFLSTLLCLYEHLIYFCKRRPITVSIPEII